MASHGFFEYYFFFVFCCFHMIMSDAKQQSVWLSSDCELVCVAVWLYGCVLFVGSKLCTITGVRSLDQMHFFYSVVVQNTNYMYKFGLLNAIHTIFEEFQLNLCYACKYLYILASEGFRWLQKATKKGILLLFSISNFLFRTIVVVRCCW